MEEKLDKLRNFSKVTFKNDADLEPLQQVLEEFELTNLIEIIPVVLNDDDCKDILKCIFLGLTQNSSSQKKRLKVIEKLITNIIDVENESNSDQVNLLNILLPELDKMKTSCLVRLTIVCIDVIRDVEKSKNTSWKDVLPKILMLLQDKRDVNYAGSEMTGLEFKREIIRTISKININPDITIPLSSMFTEISMSVEEHEEIVNKLCEMFPNIQMNQFPILVKQLLYLCKEDHVVLLLLKIRKYFSSSLIQLDEAADKIRKENRNEIANSQLIILNYIEEFSRIYRLNDLIKLCRNAANASCLLLDPFLLAVLLILSCIPAYEVQITELLKNLIIQAVNEEERKKESAWLCHIIDFDFNIDQLFSQTIQSKLCEHERVVEGLVNLSFVLLAVSGIKSKECVLKKIWRIGRITLVSLIKKHSKITKSVLQNLTDRIITGCISQQYTDCLLHLCNVASVTMVDNSSAIIRILEYTESMPGIVSQRIIIALIPLVQISPSLRDNLIVCLRKALFSRNTEVRQTAVLGFLQLLKFLKLQRVSNLSQSSLTQTTFYGPSVFTQICMDVHSQQTSSQIIRAPMNPNINEAICLEVIGILKRCFKQQVSVKITLYKGLFAAICANPQLCTIVLDVLLDHFSQFYEFDVDILPPIRFEKTIIVRNSEVTLQEPVGHLLLLIQDILVKTRTVFISVEDFDSDSARSVSKFTEILNSLVDRFSQCNLTTFHLDDGLNTTNTNHDDVKVREIVQQILAVYEALIAYVTNSLNIETDLETIRKLIGLFEVYSSIIGLVQKSEVTVKKNPKDGLEDISKEDNDAIKPLTAKKKKISKKDKNVGLKKSTVKIPETCLNLKTINRLLKIFLLEEVEWLSKEAIQEIKSSDNFFQYVMNCALEVTRQTKVRLNEEQRSSVVFNNVVSLAKLIFLKCLSKQDVNSEFNENIVTTSVECFSENVSLMITHYKSKFPQFLQEAVCVSTEEDLPRQLLPILKIYKNLLKTVLLSDDEKENEDEDTTTEHLNKVLSPTLINAISVVVLTLPNNHEVSSKILDWLISIAEKHYFKSANNSKSFMNLVFTVLRRCRSDLTLIDSLSLQLCHSFPSITDTSQDKTMRPLKMVNEVCKTHILPLVCAVLISHLDDAEYMICRFRSENFIITYLKPDEYNPLTQCNVLKRREKELCQHITHIILMAENLISIAAPSGPCLELILKFLTKTFSVLTALAKYFMSRSTATESVYQDALFHKLVKIAGSSFIRQEASELILYVEKDYENESKKNLTHLSNQAKKQFVLLPKLVTEMESFSKTVMQLSKKCKDISLRNSIKLTITRDFRLNLQKVDELISKQNESDSDEENEDTISNSPPLSSTRLSNSEPSQKRLRTS